MGSATVSLYADRMAEEVRPTDDIDILIELWAHKEYAAIEEQLRKIGFVNDQESGIICRYTIQGITVDIMATGEDVLGFTNKWYPDGFKNALDYKIDDEHTIRIFPLHILLQQNWKLLKARIERIIIMVFTVPILKTLFSY